MRFKFVSGEQIEKIDEEFTGFSDDSPEAARWSVLRERLYSFLKQFAHDEESENAPEGSRGFLMQDEHDNTTTLGMEFNDPKLVDKKILLEMGNILGETDPKVKISVTVYVGQRMEFILLLKNVIYIPNFWQLRIRLGRFGWFSG